MIKGPRLVTEIKAGDPLYKYFSLTFLGHLLLFLTFYLFSFVSDRVLDRKSKKLIIIQSSVRVDVVGMPKFTLKELRQMNVAGPLGKGTGGKKSDVPILREKKSSSSFLDKIKAFSKKRVARKKSAKKERKFRQNARDEKSLSKLILAGNKLSKGSSLTGKINSEELSELRRYMESLPQYVRPHWVLPSYLREKDLQCRIQIFIGREGKLLKSVLIKSSGDDQYDHYALDAVEKTQFPTPKDSFLKELVQGVVVLGFPL